MKSVERNLIFGGVNPNGALSKITTIRKTIRETQSAVWMMQETRVSQQGKIKFDGYVTYEHTRAEKDGGGLSLSALVDLRPAFVRDGGEAVESLTVIIHLKQITISCNTAYGPQESAPIQKKADFWKYLEEEVDRAKKEGNGFMLQGDMNAWLGPDVLTGDTRKQNQNGKMFVTFVNSNKLTIVNTLPICKGNTTWSRMKLGAKLCSTLDFFVVCERLLPYVQEMTIDNEGNHKITNYKDGQNTTESDHTPMWIKVNMKVAPERPEEVEVLNFKDVIAQQRFKVNTSKTKEFSDCLKSKEEFNVKIENWKHILEKHCKQAFPVIRIRRRNLKPSSVDKLIDRRNTLAKQSKDKNIEELECLNVTIAQMIADEERAKCHKMKKFCDQDGSINTVEMWKLKKKTLAK